MRKGISTTERFAAANLHEYAAQQSLFVLHDIPIVAHSRASRLVSKSTTVLAVAIDATTRARTVLSKFMMNGASFEGNIFRDVVDTVSLILRHVPTCEVSLVYIG